MVRSAVAVLAAAAILLCAQVHAQCNNPLAHAKTATGYCAYTYASGLGAPRGITVVSNNDILYVDQKAAQVLVAWEDSSSHTVKKAVIAKETGLNHAVIYQNGYLYASNATTVFRWRYAPGNRADLGTGQVVVNNLPCCHHTTRSLIFDSNNLLYVQSGSGDNVDPDSTHSRIRRFSVASIPSGGLTWSNGELFADGLRNEVGLRFDSNGKLWGVENGVDDLNRPDLGGDIHKDNPSEEVNAFEKSGLFYGYPYCWSQYNLNNSLPRGTQWAHPNFMNDGTHTDAWCQNKSNVVLPAYSLPAHTAPLDIIFYYGKTFPNVQGDAFVSSHGSWNRIPAQGYNVRHLKFTNGAPVSDDVFLGYEGPGETGSDWPHRPVGLAFGKCWGVECMLVTSDASGQIIAVTLSSPKDDNTSGASSVHAHALLLVVSAVALVASLVV